MYIFIYRIEYTDLYTIINILKNKGGNKVKWSFQSTFRNEVEESELYLL